MWRLIFLVLFPFSLSAQWKRFEYSEIKMGSPFRIVFYSHDSVDAAGLARHCFNLIDTLNSIFSDYDSASEAGRLMPCRPGQAYSVSREMLHMIRLSKEAWKKSHKTFDITIGALTQLWRQSKKENRFPTPAEVKAAKELCGFRHIVVNNKTRTVSFKKQGLRLDFGAIAKGHIAQRVIDFLKNKNIPAALADAGGDIVMSGAPPEKNGWIIGINLPGGQTELWDRKLELKNGAVATSGDVYQYTIHKGKRYSHILDPRTGYGLTMQKNVTVIADNGAAADWLATACSILPVKKALRLAQKENAALLIAVMEKEKIVFFKTKSFDAFIQKPAL